MQAQTDPYCYSYCYCSPPLLPSSVAAFYRLTVSLIAERSSLSDRTGRPNAN